MDLKSKIILISGPTASGKSKFAIQLAKKINGEVINADSMQIFKELKILTARPQQDDLKNIKHHLYGFKSVKDNYSTGNKSNHVEGVRYFEKDICDISSFPNSNYDIIYHYSINNYFF